MRISCTRRAVATACLVAWAVGCERAPRQKAPQTAAAAGPTAAATEAAAPSAKMAATPSDEQEAQEDSGDADETEEGLDDDVEGGPAPDATILPPHPLAAVSKEELDRRLVRDPASLGAMSIGKPSAGLLFNAVAMPAGDAWSLVDPSHAFGTDETVGYVGSPGTELEFAL